MNNKVDVIVYVPKIEKKYEILIPIDKDIYSVTKRNN